MGQKYFSTVADQKARARFHDQQQRKKSAGVRGRTAPALPAEQPVSPPAPEAPSAGGPKSRKSS